MNRNTIRKWITMAVCAVAALCFFSCEKNDDSWPDNPIPEYNAKKVFVIHPTDQGERIAFAKSNKLVIEYISDKLQHEVVSQGDSVYASFKLKNPAEFRPFVVKAKVKYKDAYNQSLASEVYLVAQYPSRSIVIEDQEFKKYMRNLGKSTNVVGEYFNMKETILNIDALVAAGYVDINESTSKGVQFELGGVRYTEMQERIDWEFGLSGKKAGKGMLFSGSFGNDYKKDEKESNKFEYNLMFCKKSINDAKLRATLVDNTDSLLAYADPAILDMLNNPNAKSYNNYTNNYEGIKKLYDKYGTHIMTSGVYGGLFCYIYSRKQNAYYESVEYAAAAEFSAKYPAVKGDKDNWVDSYLKAVNAEGVSAYASGGNYSENYRSASVGKLIAFCTGGSVSMGYDEWSKSITGSNSELSMISYGTNKEDAEDGLVPLYMLCKDEARRKAMEEYLVRYQEEHRIVPKEPARLVIADFKMSKAPNGHVQKDTYMVGTLQGRQVIYFPLVANDNAPVDKGKMLETSQSTYIAVADRTDQLWWYALAPEDECTGITDICFRTTSSDGYSIVGDRADDDMGYPDIDNHYVALKYANSTTRSEDKITAVGIIRSANNSSHCE